MKQSKSTRQFQLPPEIQAISPELRERFVSIASEDARRVYRWLEDEELRARLETRLAYPDALNLWQESIRIRVNPMLPGTYVELPDSRNRDLAFWSSRYSVEFRTYMLALSISMAKAITDMILGGLYTQAFILQRSALESWKRCLYARMRPEDIFRWIPSHWTPELEALPDFQRASDVKLSKKDWQLAESRLGAADAALLGMCNQVSKGLHDHVHPGLEGASQIFFNLDRFSPNASSFYSQPHAHRAIRNALILEALFLFETENLARLPVIPHRRIIKFVNGPLNAELRRFFAVDSQAASSQEPIEPVRFAEE